jgi:hypothetical protein
MLIVASCAGLLIWGFAISPAPSPTTYNRISDQQTLDALRDDIVLNGFACEKVTYASVKGMSPYGIENIAMCGPAGSSDVYKGQQYAVYPERRRVEICKPGTFGVC